MAQAACKRVLTFPYMLGVYLQHTCQGVSSLHRADHRCKLAECRVWGLGSRAALQGSRCSRRGPQCCGNMLSRVQVQACRAHIGLCRPTITPAGSQASIELCKSSESP